MVEGVLVKEALSISQVQAGEELLRRLDANRSDIVAAYWTFNPEVGKWRLELVSPQVESKGPLRFYAQVFWWLDAEPRLSPLLETDSITAQGPNYSFYRELLAAVNSKKEL